MAELPEGRIAANGLVFSTPEAGPKDGPPVLCLHGFPDHPRSRPSTPFTWLLVLVPAGRLACLGHDRVLLCLGDQAGRHEVLGRVATQET